MRILPSRLSTLWYANLIGEEEEQDEYGHYTGRMKPIYSSPVKAALMISPANGNAHLAETGIQTDDTRKMISNDFSIPFSETTILWIDKEPVVNGAVTPHNYVVESVQKSLFAVGITARKVIVHEADQNQRTER